MEREPHQALAGDRPFVIDFKAKVQGFLPGGRAGGRAGGQR
ncbi:hypothetical protein [Streptomyces wuyuanensis]